MTELINEQTNKEMKDMRKMPTNEQKITQPTKKIMQCCKYFI